MFSLTFTSTYLFLFVLIFFFGHAGALFNPALVLMSRTNKNINNKETITYITAELVGTILAGLTTYIIAATCSPSSFGNQ
jgi:glycerol uptake facilitator-like aquaporin